MPIKNRVCTGPCGRSLPQSEFWRDSKQRDGYMTRCKQCTQERREELAQRRAGGEVVPTISDELRQQRSERAKKLHAEGKFGGAEFGRLGGLGRHRINDYVLDYFRERPHLVAQAIEKALRSKSHGYRLRAAELILKDERENERAQKDNRGGATDPAEMTQEQLEEFVMQGLRAQIERGELSAEALQDVMGTITLPDDAIQDVA